MASKPYKGALAKRLPKLSTVNALAMLAGGEYRIRTRATIEREVAEEFAKLPLLLEHYAIDEHDPSAFLKLAVALARHHVPGFRRMKARAGPKQKWTDLERAELSVEIEIYRAFLRSKGVRATKLAAATQIHEAALFGKKAASAKALLKQAEMADPRWVKVVRDAEAFREATEDAATSESIARSI